MFNKITVGKSRKFFSVALVLGLLLSLCAVQSVYAENGATNKAINVLGYELDQAGTPNTLKVYLDKNMTIDILGSGSDTYKKWQFRVFQGSTPIAISSVAVASGSGVDPDDFPPGVILPNGCTVTLSFSSALSTSTTYTCVVSRTIRANNNLTIGDFIVNDSGNKTDRSFAFSTHDGSGNYPATIITSKMPMDNTTSGVPVEGNVGFIVDRPVNAYDAAELTDEDTSVDLTLTDDDGNCVDSHCYAPMYVHSRTGFFFPLTYGKDYTTSYNLDYNSDHDFYIPVFDDVNANSSTAETIEFHTVATDVPAKFTAAPTYTAGSPGTLSWTDLDSLGAESYNVYRSNFNYWDWDSTPVATVDTPDYSTSWTPSSGTFVRVEALNSNENAGGLSQSRSE